MYDSVLDEGVLPAIQRLPLSGGSPEVIATVEGGFAGFSVDGQHAYFYGAAAPAGISRVSLAGGAPELLLEEPLVRGLAVREERLYYVRNNTALLLGSTFGTEPQEVATVTSNIGSLLAGPWALPSEGALFYAPTEGPGEQLATDQAGISSLTLDGDALYWSVSAVNQNGFERGDIMKLSPISN